MSAAGQFTIAPKGPFSLAVAQRFFEGFTPAAGSWAGGGEEILLAFPVEGWQSSAAVAVHHASGERIAGQVFGTEDLSGAKRQVARCLSLDHDGTGWPSVGERDAVLGRIQRDLDYLRPVCFYSPYEAAAHAVIGHRIQMRQASRIKSELSAELGEEIAARGTALHAFPLPQDLLRLSSLRSLTDEKVGRLHAVAEAALEGLLEADHLRSLPAEEAFRQLRELPGIGEWSAAHVLLRGCGVADELPMADPRARQSVQLAYGLDEPPGDVRFAEIAEPWRPYRTWACVLLRAWAGRQTAMGGSRDAGEGRVRTSPRPPAPRSAPR